MLLCDINCDSCFYTCYVNDMICKIYALDRYIVDCWDTCAHAYALFGWPFMGGGS